MALSPAEVAGTGLVVVDPYNDFISDGGKYWERLRDVCESVDCVSNMTRVLEAAREARLQVVFAPHRRWRPHDYDGWIYLAPIQRRSETNRAFEYGTWGGTFRNEFTPLPADVVASEHWCSSGFANTDLDFHLKKRGIRRIIVIGLIANTCIESTIRHAVELGYDVTLVRDATASFSWEAMTATLELNVPNYASSILTSDELIHWLAKTTRLPIPSDHDGYVRLDLAEGSNGQ